jgi:hypothetical protein
MFESKIDDDLVPVEALLTGKRRGTMENRLWAKLVDFSIVMSILFTINWFFGSGQSRFTSTSRATKSKWRSEGTLKIANELCADMICSLRHDQGSLPRRESLPVGSCRPNNGRITIRSLFRQRVVVPIAESITSYVWALSPRRTCCLSLSNPLQKLATVGHRGSSVCQRQSDAHKPARMPCPA